MIRLVGFVFAAVLILVGCSSPEHSAKNQGIITYDVSFPFNQNELLSYIYPEEMEVAFRDHEITGEIEAMGGIVANRFVVDNRGQIFDQFLKTNKGRFHMALDSVGMIEMLLASPQMKLMPTDRVDTLAGYACKLTIAEFKSDSVPPIELWHTAAIPVENPNWCNPYHGLDEFLLGYDVEYLGMRMRVRAREVDLTDVGDSRFELLNGYEEVDYAGMQDHVNELLAVISKP